MQRAVGACRSTSTLDGSMYGLSPDVDLGCFVGAEVHQISVAKFDVQFHFASSARIAVQSRVRVLRGGGLIAEWSEAAGWTSVEFQGLLNGRVMAAAMQSPRVLELRFANGLLLELLDDSEQYESMQIYYPGADMPIVV